MKHENYCTYNEILSIVLGTHALYRRVHALYRRVHALYRRVHALYRRAYALYRRAHALCRRAHAFYRRVHALYRRAHALYKVVSDVCACVSVGYMVPDRICNPVYEYQKKDYFRVCFAYVKKM